MNLCDLELYISLYSVLWAAGEFSSCQNLPMTDLAAADCVQRENHVCNWVMHCFLDVLYSAWGYEFLK